MAEIHVASVSRNKLISSFAATGLAITALAGCGEDAGSKPQYREATVVGHVLDDQDCSGGRFQTCDGPYFNLLLQQCGYEEDPECRDFSYTVTEGQFNSVADGAEVQLRETPTGDPILVVVD